MTGPGRLQRLLAMDVDQPDRSIIESFVRLGSSAGLGLVASFVMYEIVYGLLPDLEFRGSIAWLLGYLIGVAIQHSLHRRLVFGGAAHYWTSLRRTYAVYSVGSMLALGLNAGAIALTDWPHRLIWLLTTLAVALINIVALKLYAFDPATGSDHT